MILDALLAAILEERKERAGRPAVGSPGIVVVNRGAQEVLDAVARLASGALENGVGIVMVAPMVIGLGQVGRKPPFRAEAVARGMANCQNDFLLGAKHFASCAPGAGA